MQNENFINSVNINSQTNFPYLVLNIENNKAYPISPGFGIMHWHEDLQFTYVLKGKIRVKTLEDEKIISAGKGIFINKNVIHHVELFKNCSYKSFIFPEYFLKFYLGSPANNFVEKVTENKKISTISISNAEILKILDDLSNLEDNKNSFYQYEVLVNLSSLWLRFIKNLSIPMEKVAENVTNQRMMKFLQFINSHYSEEISLEDLAKSANVSKSECLRCFRATLKISPYKYLMDFRIAKAAKLLSDSNLSIAEISNLVGFNQQSYFGKCFKEKIGCSPLAFRKQK